MKQIVTGMDGALRFYGQMRDAGGRWTGAVTDVYSNLKYASPIEFGRTRDGRWIRKAGEARYLRGGLDAAATEAHRLLPAALRGGPAAVEALKATLNKTAVRVAREVVPVRSGALRGSIRSTPRTQ